MFSRFLIAAIVVLAVGAPMASAAVNLVVNPGFETGDFTGWTVSGNTQNVFVGGAPYNHSGSFGAALGPRNTPGILTQSTDIVTTPGDLYVVSFWLRNFMAVGTTFTADWDGANLVTLINAPPANAWTHYVFDVAAVDASTTLSFSYQNQQSTFALDDVSVTIPEPSTILVWTGLGALGLVMAWRKRKSAA